MQNRNDILRIILFFGISIAIMSTWQVFFGPKGRNNKKKDPAQENVVAQNDKEQPDEKTKPATDPQQPEKVESVQEQPGEPSQPKIAAAPQQPAQLQKHEHNDNILLGSLDPETGYFLQARLTTSGASVVDLKLSDPRYKELDNLENQLSVVGNSTSEIRTLETSIESIDEQLKEHNTSLKAIDWNVETVPDPNFRGLYSEATFTYTAPDGTLELSKTFKLTRINKTGAELVEARDLENSGYVLDFDLKVKNLGQQNQNLQYTLQGPVGLPLENKKNTRIHRNFKMRYIDADGDLDSTSKTGAALVKDIDAAIEEAKENGSNLNDAEANLELDRLGNPIKYIGIDVQYFAALLLPNSDQKEEQYTEYALPFLTQRAGKKGIDSDLSLTLISKSVDLAPNQELAHSYTLFAGPKRQELLEPLGAGDVIEFGWFGVVSKVMLGVLTFLHDYLAFPYGVAIICLTILVRSMMFPVTWKQTKGAQKMKELQPKIAELKKKYAKDKEKFARAQMELFSQHNYNPLAGCLPLFIQLPIFIGLYQSLSNAVDLRLAPFLWFDNLAAPDALIKMPWDVFFLGEYFNLLPILTVFLFIAQQKLTMPPPTDEQQAMQQKMMSYFSVFIGFMFYHVPAGLCIYFIASSLWGLGERKLLDRLKAKAPAVDLDDASPVSAGSKKIEKQQQNPKKKPGFWDKLLNAADQAAQQSQKKTDKDSDGSKTNGAKRNKKNKSRSKR